jgi:hypothetical protein
MPDVGRKDVLDVSAAEDQDPVEALSADAADPALGVLSGAQIRSGCADLPLLQADRACEPYASE